MSYCACTKAISKIFFAELKSGARRGLACDRVTKSAKISPKLTGVSAMVKGSAPDLKIKFFETLALPNHISIIFTILAWSSLAISKALALIAPIFVFGNIFERKPQITPSFLKIFNVFLL